MRYPYIQTAYLEDYPVATPIRGQLIDGWEYAIRVRQSEAAAAVAGKQFIAMMAEKRPPTPSKTREKA